MSVENAKALIAKAKEDKALSEKLKAAGIDGFEKAAAEAGHPCTVEQVTEALKASGELDETALDSVAGGLGCGSGSVSKYRMIDNPHHIEELPDSDIETIIYDP